MTNNKTYLTFSHKATLKKKSCLVDIVVLNFLIKKFKAKIKCKFKIDKILEFVVYNFVVYDWLHWSFMRGFIHIYKGPSKLSNASFIIKDELLNSRKYTMKSDVKERCWLCSDVEMRVEAACIFFGSVYRWKYLKIFLLILRRRHEFHHKYWY